MPSGSGTTTATARHDRTEELAHLVGGSARHREYGVVPRYIPDELVAADATQIV